MVIIQEKVCSLFQDLKREEGAGTKSETFGASRGWFASFKARHKLPSPGASGEAPGPGVIQEGAYTAWQVFNVGETELFWKRLPIRTCLSMVDK